MTKPNIVLFLTDDHGAWANGCYGNTEVQTPALDRLAAQGARFANAFTPTPVCSPARACLLTGRAASQVGIHDWLQEAVTEIGDRDWIADDKTLFEHLHEAGYQTALCGKWHLGQSHLPPRGADYHFGLPRWQGAHNQVYTYVRNGAEVTLDGNKSQFITDHALAFLDQTTPGQPFFLNVGYIATHSPYDQQSHHPDVTRLYQDTTFRDIPPYEPHPWVKNEGTPNHPTDQELRDRYIGYYASVTEIDRNVARIVARLEAMGQLDHTVIIYTSDHGCSTGQNGFWGKGNSTRPLNMVEVSLRIPLIWRGPGVEPGHVVERCVDHYDTFQTIMALAGVTPDPQRAHPGASYARMLGGERIAWDDTRYGEYGDLRMIRTPEWKLVWRYPDGPHDLFNLRGDPGETRNLYGALETQPLADDLKARLDAFYDSHDNPAKSGLRVKELPRHNDGHEAWRDGKREARGLQVY
jgi:arylsulfatase A-like enzyme